jgi:prevent-host-death family protein
MKVSAKDLRTQTKRILEAAARGEEVIVSYRGQPRAKITAIGENEQGSGVAGSPLFGMWRDHDETRDVSQYLDRLRKSRY